VLIDDGSPTLSTSISCSDAPAVAAADPDAAPVDELEDDDPELGAQAATRAARAVRPLPWRSRRRFTVRPKELPEGPGVPGVRSIGQFLPGQARLGASWMGCLVD